MSMPTTHAHLRSYKNNSRNAGYLRAATNNVNSNRFSIFMRRFNPANWFNEFSDIKISLEEFSASKNNTAKK